MNLNNALFVNKYLGPPGLYILSSDTPGAEIKSTFFTRVLGECSSLNKIIWGTTKYIKGEPNDPGNLLSTFGYSPVPTKFIFALPSIWTPPKKKVSILP